MTWAPIDTGDPAANRLINVSSALADPSPLVWWNRLLTKAEALAIP